MYSNTELIISLSSLYNLYIKYKIIKYNYKLFFLYQQNSLKFDI